MGKHNIPMTRRSHSAGGGISLTRRPKRNVSIKTYDDTVGLSRTEERELKKALYASLQESKRLYRYQQESDEKPMSSHVQLVQRPARPMRSRSWPHTPSQCSTATHSTNASVDESSQDSVKSSVSSVAELKNKQERKIHAQRKFAQGSLPPTPNTTPVKVKTSPIKLLPKTAKTEDFLTFLCLRGSSVLPPHLDFFNFSRGEPSHGEISAPQTPPPSETNSKPSERTRESTPESSSVSTNDELYEIGTPSPSSFIVNGRNGLSARKAARASASTPETARGIVSLSQGLTKKTTRVSTPHRGRKYGSVEKTPSPRKGSPLVRGQLTPSKRGFAVKSLSPQFSKTAQEKKLSLKQKPLLSFLPRKTSTKLGTASGKAAGSKQLMLEGTEQVNNKPVVCSHAALRRSTRLQSVVACTRCTDSSASFSHSAHITCTDSLAHRSCSKSVSKLQGRKKASTNSHKLGKGCVVNAVDKITSRNWSQSFEGGNYHTCEESLQGDGRQFAASAKEDMKVSEGISGKVTLTQSSSRENVSNEDSGSCINDNDCQMTTVLRGERLHQTVDRLWSRNPLLKNPLSVQIEKSKLSMISSPCLPAFRSVGEDGTGLKTEGLNYVGKIPIYGQRRPEVGTTISSLLRPEDKMLGTDHLDASDDRTSPTRDTMQEDPDQDVFGVSSLEIMPRAVLNRPSQEKNVTQETLPERDHENEIECSTKECLFEDDSRNVQEEKTGNKEHRRVDGLPILDDRTGMFISEKGKELNVNGTSEIVEKEVTVSSQPDIVHNSLEDAVQQSELDISDGSCQEESEERNVCGSKRKTLTETTGLDFKHVISEYDNGRSRNPLIIDSDCGSDEEQACYKTGILHTDSHIDSGRNLTLGTVMSENVLKLDRLSDSQQTPTVNDTHSGYNQEHANEDRYQISSLLNALINLCSSQQHRLHSDCQVGGGTEREEHDTCDIDPQDLEEDSHQIGSLLNSLVNLCSTRQRWLDPDTQVGGGVEQVSQEGGVPGRLDSAGNPCITSYPLSHGDILNQDQVVPHIGLELDSDALTEWRSSGQGELVHFPELQMWNKLTGLNQDLTCSEETGQVGCDDADVTEVCFIEEDGSECSVTIYTSKKEMSQEECQEHLNLLQPDVKPPENFELDCSKIVKVPHNEDAKLDPGFESDVKDLLHEYESSWQGKMDRQNMCNTKPVGSKQLEVKDDSFEEYMQNLPPECVIDKQRGTSGHLTGVCSSSCSSHLSSLLEDSGDYRETRESESPPLIKPTQPWTSTKDRQFCQNTLADTRSLAQYLFSTARQENTDLDQHQLLESEEEDPELIHGASVSATFDLLQDSCEVITDGTDLNMSLGLEEVDETFMYENLPEHEHYDERNEFLPPSHSCAFRDLVWPHIPVIANFYSTDPLMEKFEKNKVCKDAKVLEDTEEMCEDVFMGPDIEHTIESGVDDKTTLVSSVTEKMIKQPMSKTELPITLGEMSDNLEEPIGNTIELCGNIPIQVNNPESCLPFKKRTRVTNKQGKREEISFDYTQEANFSLPTLEPRIKKQCHSLVSASYRKLQNIPDIPLYPWSTESRTGNCKKIESVGRSIAGNPRTCIQKTLTSVSIPKQASRKSIQPDPMAVQDTYVHQPLGKAHSETVVVAPGQNMEYPGNSSRKQFIPLDTMLHAHDGRSSSDTDQSQTHASFRNVDVEKFPYEDRQDISTGHNNRAVFPERKPVSDQDHAKKPVEILKSEGSNKTTNIVDLFYRKEKLQKETKNSSDAGKKETGSSFDLFCSSRTPKKVNPNNPNFMEARSWNPEDVANHPPSHQVEKYTKQSECAGETEADVDTGFREYDIVLNFEKNHKPFVIRVLERPKERSMESQTYLRVASCPSASTMVPKGMPVSSTEIGKMGCVTSPLKEFTGETTDTGVGLANRKSHGMRNITDQLFSQRKVRDVDTVDQIKENDAVKSEKKSDLWICKDFDTGKPAFANFHVFQRCMREEFDEASQCETTKEDSDDFERRLNNSQSTLSDLVQMLRSSRNLMKMKRKSSPKKHLKIVPTLANLAFKIVESLKEDRASGLQVNLLPLNKIQGEAQKEGDKKDLTRMDLEKQKLGRNILAEHGHNISAGSSKTSLSIISQGMKTLFDFSDSISLSNIASFSNQSCQSKDGFEDLKCQQNEQQEAKTDGASSDYIPLTRLAVEKMGQLKVTPSTNSTQEAKVKDKCSYISPSAMNLSGKCEVGCQTTYGDEKEDFEDNADGFMALSKLKEKNGEGIALKTYERVCRPRNQEERRNGGVKGIFEDVLFKADSNGEIQTKKAASVLQCGLKQEQLTKTDCCLELVTKPLNLTPKRTSCHVDSSFTRPRLSVVQTRLGRPPAIDYWLVNKQTSRSIIPVTTKPEGASLSSKRPPSQKPLWEATRQDSQTGREGLGDSVQVSSPNTVHRPRKLFPPPPSVMSCGICKGSQSSFKPVNPASHAKRSAAEKTRRLKAKLKEKKKELAKQKLSSKVKKKVFMKSKLKSKSHDGKRQKGCLEEHPRKKRIVRRSSMRLKELTKALKAKRKRRRRPVEEEEEEDEVTIMLQPPARPVGKKRNFAPRPYGGEVTEMPRAVTEEFDFEIFTDEDDDEVSFGNMSSFRRTFSTKKSVKETSKKVKLRKTGVSTRSSSQKTLPSPAKIVANKCLSAVKKRASKGDSIKLSKIIERRRKLKQDDGKGEGAKRGRKPAGSKKQSSPEKPSRSDSSSKSDQSNLLEVPTFRPTEEEFRDPIQYIESIREKAEPFGMCQIIPPSSWKCESKINEEMRFTAQVQHVHSLYKRWGQNVQFTSSVCKHLDTIGADLEPFPQIGGVEVDLCKLSRTIQEFGGMQNNVDKKKWVKIADAMKIPKLAQDRGMRLYDVYCKYLLPYDTLSGEEKSRVEQTVTSDRQKKVKAGKVDDDEAIVKGKSNPLSTFIRVARNVRSMWFKDEPTPEQVECEYWRLLEERNNHVAVQCGHVSTSTQGSGFPSKKDSPYARHGWNLNNLSENPKCILRCLGPVSGATIPTLHIGMMFATSCWCTDIHHLPYIQYLHTGVDIVWYSIPKQQENKFKAAMKDMVPSLVSDDPRWLKEDTVMVNPAHLTARGVTVARCVQKPKTFVAIFPKSYTATISCGYNVSESVHYATRKWISTGVSVAEDLSKSVEPELFSMDALLSHLISDPTTDLQTLKVAVPFFEKVLSRELSQRKQLYEAGLKAPKRGGMSDDMPSPPSRKRSIDQVEENVCDVSKKHCFFSKVVNESENLTLSLEEGLKHVQKKKNLKHCKLNFRYTEEELKSMLQSAQCRLDISGNNDGSSGSKKRGMKK